MSIASTNSVLDFIIVPHSLFLLDFQRTSSFRVASGSREKKQTVQVTPKAFSPLGG
jgi:hypothetical protein